MVGMKFGLSPGEVFFDVLATGSVFGVGATMTTSASWPSSNYNTQKKFSRTQPEFHSNHTNRSILSPLVVIALVQNVR